MASIKKYNGSSFENAAIRKYSTASEIITPPTIIYADGSNIITYSIKGNSVQNGTPTPSNPVDVMGVGTLDSGDYKITVSSGQQATNIYLGSTSSTRQIKKYVCTGNETVRAYDATYSRTFVEIPDMLSFGIRTTPIVCTHFQGIYDGRAIADVPDNSVYTGAVNQDHGIYVKETDYPSRQSFKDFLQEQYENQTPVTIWYAIATPETTAVNEPLMKIGDYADTFSNAAQIPTTEGANSITVDTQVQPSEFTATWTGWHNASDKEWDGSQWT